MNKKSVVGATLLAGVLSLNSATQGHATEASPNRAADHYHATIYSSAQHLIREAHIHVPWDGRYSYNEKTELCIETFNGSSRIVKQYGYGVPPGFYLKFCQAGPNDFQVHDGTPFRGMEAY